MAPDHPTSWPRATTSPPPTRAAGRTAEAIPLHEQTLADRERVLGPDHPDTLAPRSNLAAAYLAAGRTAEAIPFYEQTLADRERVLGADHPDTLTARNNLAVAYEAAAGPPRRFPCSRGPWPTGSGCWARTTRHPDHP